MRSLMTLLAFALAIPGVCAFAAEHGTFPERPVRLIVPFPPGGVNDIASRIVANQLNVLWGRPVIIDNRGGANGNIGAEIAAKANPDGYTLFIVSSSITSNVALYRKLPFDLERDFTPVSTLVTGAYVLVVNPSVQATSVRDLVQLAKVQPGKLNFSSFGEGSSAHLVAELFKRMAAVDLVHVPYKGGGPAMAAVVAGEVHMTFSNLFRSDSPGQVRQAEGAGRHELEAQGRTRYHAIARRSRPARLRCDLLGRAAGAAAGAAQPRWPPERRRARRAVGCRRQGTARGAWPGSVPRHARCPGSAHSH